MKRLPDCEKNKVPEGWGWDVISYWKAGDVWMLNLGAGQQGNLSQHDVVEHEDGTITVSPSILLEGTHHRHGYLRRGIWEPCSDDRPPAG